MFPTVGFSTYASAIGCMAWPSRAGGQWRAYWLHASARTGFCDRILCRKGPSPLSDTHPSAHTLAQSAYLLHSHGSAARMLEW